MTLEELKKAMDDALAALAAKPDDTALKAAADEATTAYNAAVAAAEDDGDGFDESKADEATKKYIAKLRSENAKHRTKNKDLVSSKKSSDEKLKAVLKAAGIEDESEDPAEKLKAATATSEQLAFTNAVLEIAVEHGIPKANIKFFRFLVSEAVGELGEGEELSDEKMAEIVAQVKATGDGKGSSTSVGTGGKGGSAAPKPGASGQISLDQFCSMTITEKSKLYTERPEVYTALYAEAKKKKKLV